MTDISFFLPRGISHRSNWRLVEEQWLHIQLPLDKQSPNFFYVLYRHRCAKIKADCILSSAYFLRSVFPRTFRCPLYAALADLAASVFHIFLWAVFSGNIPPEKQLGFGIILFTVKKPLYKRTPRLYKGFLSFVNFVQIYIFSCRA